MQWIIALWLIPLGLCADPEGKLIDIKIDKWGDGP